MSSGVKTLFAVMWGLAGLWFVVTIGAGATSEIEHAHSGSLGNPFTQALLDTMASVAMGTPPAIAVGVGRFLYLRRRARQVPIARPITGSYTTTAGYPIAQQPLSPPVTAPAPAPLITDLPLSAQLTQLAPPLQGPWTRLARAWTTVGMLRNSGWVDADSIAGVPQALTRLHRFAVAEGLAIRSGTPHSSDAGHRMNQLATLLETVADDAAELQAAAESAPTPVTLATAAGRLTADNSGRHALLALAGQNPPGDVSGPHRIR